MMLHYFASNMKDIAGRGTGLNPSIKQDLEPTNPVILEPAIDLDDLKGLKDS